MRIYELTTRLSAISRAKTEKYPNGRRSTACAAYRAACTMSDELTGESWDYGKKGGVAFSNVFTAAHAPAWMQDRGKLWNAAEKAEESSRHKNRAQPAKEIMFGFADEISEAGKQAVLADVAAFLIDQGAAAVDANIHSPGKAGDHRNWHAHVMFPTRLCDGEKFIKKAAWQVQRAEGAKFAKALRKFIADRQNQQLVTEGKADAVRVEFKSFKARGEAKSPTQHMGVSKTNAIRKEKSVDRQAWIQEKAAAQKSRQTAEKKALRERQNADWRKLAARQADLKRQRAQQLVREAREARRGQKTTTPLQNLFMRLTGQKKRVSEAAREQASVRLQKIRRELKTLKTEVDSQKIAVREAQKSERETLKERHSIENSRLSQAFRAKDQFDRTAVVAQRQSPDREPAREQDNQREIGQDRSEGRSLHP